MLAASAAAGQIIKISIASGALPVPSTPDGNGTMTVDLEAVRGFSFMISGTTDVVNQVNAYNTNTSTGGVEMYVSSSAGNIASGADGLLFYFAQPTQNNAGDFENTAAIPEINIQMRSLAIVAKTRKLKAVWTPEFAQDLNAYQALDAEAEVTNIMSEYISLEIDLEILDMLIEDAAAGTEYWTVLNNGVYNGGSTTDGFTFPTSTSQTGLFNTQGQWFQTLLLV